MSHPWMPFYVADYLADTGHLRTAEHGAYDTSEITGWRICNGKTISSATSGASYANDNAQALFEYLWSKDADLAVIGGRGANAAADWAANKRLTLPDYRGYALVGRDGMGNSAAGRLGELADLSDRTGAATITLTSDQLPSHTHTASTAAAGAHGHSTYVSTVSNGNSDEIGGIMLNADVSSVRPANVGSTGPAAGSQIGAATDHTHDVTVHIAGGSQAHSNVQPSAGITVYIKL